MSKRLDILIFCLGLILLVAACRTTPIICDDPLGCVVVQANNPIRLATLLPVTGETAVWGQELSRGINLALTNQGNDILGHTIDLIPLDSACDPSSSQQALQTINGDDTVLGIIGPACSDVAQAILPTVYRNNWLLISPASTAPSLTENQSERAFFRTIPNHLHQATVAAHFAYEVLGARQTAVFQDETVYNSLLAQQFDDTFAQLGGNIRYQATLSTGQTETADMLTNLVTISPDLIYLALFEPEATLLVNQLADIPSLDHMHLLGGDNLFTSHFANSTGEAATGMFITNPVLTSPAYSNFLNEWAVRYNTLPSSPSPAYAYDATKLVLAAIEDVAVTGQTGALVIGRNALREQMQAMGGFIGLTGSLRCDAAGECAAATYGLYELETAVFSNNSWPPPLFWQFGSPVE
ncbi:MAG: ABC transporter substrate-binding protein [Chloroflexi bacterium]|nr:ABC transporter substrate-binding protein [Chloroflexota bacterium]